MARIREPRARAFATRTVTPRPGNVIVDVALVAAIFAVFFGVVLVAREWKSPLAVAPPIDLDPRQLPVYTLYSLARGLAAYVLSLLFTIVYAKAAVASRRSERFLLPVLDILQSIPVLSFMPGLVLGLIWLLPGSNVGLELACVLAIFTGQVWNMTFSFHGSLRAIPQDQLEVARINGFGRMKRLFAVELPSAMNGLVWNSMLSMAGGWFFLTIVEAFTLDGRTFRLPGLGSYMATAVDAGDGRAMAWAVVAMITMIVAVDQLLWRPLIVWAERFRNEDVASASRPKSWFLDLLRGSPLARWIRTRGQRAAAEAAARLPRHATRPPGPSRVAAPAGEGKPSAWLRIAGGLIGLAIAAWCAVGAVKLVRLLAPLGASSWLAIARALGFTALRVVGALLLGSLWTIPAGLLIGRSPRASGILLPIIQVLASFPAPMLYPIVVPWLFQAGIGPNAVAIVLMTLGTQWYVLFNVAAGTAAVPHDLREVAAVYRLPRLNRLMLVEFGAVFPFLVPGLLTAAGGAWNASIVSEAVRYPGGSSDVDGVGALIASSFASGDVATLAAATLAVASALVLVNRILWKPLQRLAATRFALNR